MRDRSRYSGDGPPAGSGRAGGESTSPAGRTAPESASRSDDTGPATTSAGALLPSLSLPKGGGAIRGIGEKFSTDAATGTGALSVPIATSPGRAGFELSLSLGYDSGAGNGPFGIGWQLSTPAITRKTDKGLPRYLDAEESDVFILSGAEDLVPTRGGAFNRGAYRIRRYRSRVEGLFARIERWTRKSDGDVHWRATTRDNVMNMYGATPGSRIADPRDPRRVFSWLLEETRDDRGNVARYTYKAEDGAGVSRRDVSEASRFDDGVFVATAQRYLGRIQYGNRSPIGRDAPAPSDDNAWLFEIIFDYGEHAAPPAGDRHATTAPAPTVTGPWPVRPDAFSSYRAGFEVRTYRLCRRVLAFHRFADEQATLGVNPALVRSTDFTYDEGPVVTYLTRVTQAGYQWNDASARYQRATLPSLDLDYTRPELHDELRTIDRESLAGIPSGVDGGFHQWVDLDGEGIPGVLSAYDRGWTYKRNQGGGKLAPPVALGSLPSPADLGGGAQLTDLAGDGQLDLVAYTAPLPGYFTRTAEGGWRPFAAFQALPNIDWNDPNLRFLDLDGDGHPDVLVTEQHALRWYRSRAKDGFEPERRVSKEQDERRSPALIFSDGTETLFLADMSGDGLTDIVRVRNGEVCYWPNFGYGRFGAKITLAHSPTFDSPDHFDPRRIRLADIDGSGTTDVLYLGGDGVAIYLNQSGNALSERVFLRSLPVVDAMTTLSVVDLLGQGTACLVWSSPLPGQRATPIRYVDLMGGRKPHLLTSVANNLGGETRLTYAPSTKFYLQDRAAGKPWLTRLAFPVQVLEQVERLDHVVGSRLVTRFAYHHGFFDGHEREFRGFARVEQWDAESFEAGGNQPPYDVDAADPALNLPPVRTVTWFHTGAWLERERLERELSREYYQNPQAPLLPDTVLPPSLTLSEQRQAARALRGAVLRQEIYAEDGTPESVHPYTVSERNYEVRLVQSAEGEGHAVLFTHPRETVDLHYERRPNDPRMQQVLTLEVDDFGNVTEAAALAYPRRAPEQAEQGRLWAVLTQSSFANGPDEPDWYRVGVPVEVATAELTGLAAPAHGRLTASEVRVALAGALEIPYETTPTSGRHERRVVERRRILYYRDDLSGPLPLGDVAPRALPFETYRLALTPGLVTEVYDGRVNNEMLTNEGRYVQQDGLWWAPSGRVLYDDAARAAALFFLPEKARDPFGQVQTVVYDPYALLVREARDPLGNTMLADHDYRVLAPRLVTDPNQNRIAVAFDALGMVVKTAVMGKEGAGEGDTLEDPTTTLTYDLHRFVSAGKPAFVKTRARERHRDSATRYQESYSYTDGTGREVMRKVQAEPGLAPTRDGTGALVRDAEGQLVQAHTDTRWVGTGRTVFDNKNNPIKQYEPFFSSTPEYESEADLVEWGVTPILRYDPVGRLVRTDGPDGTFSRVLFDAWKQETWDPNDTVLDSRWYAARGSPDPGGAEPRGDPEKRAAWLAAQHAQTPAIAHLDSLGRTFLTIAHNRFARDGVVVNESYETRTALDVEGNPLSVTDPRSVVVLRQVFDVLGRVVATVSPDAGERRMLPDVGEKPVRAWDGRDHAFRHLYDALQRPTHVFVAGADGAEVLVQRMVYGESLGVAAVARNLRGQVLRHYDGAGVMENVGFDFKGNLREGARRVARNFRQVPDWSALAEPSMTPGDMAAAAEGFLEPETFAIRTEYDALNRVVSRTTPDGSETLPSYNEAGLLESVEVRLRGASTSTTFIENIDYNARGQRTLCEYGNGTRTEYTYDPETFRLTRLVTTRGVGDRLQDLAYTHDPVGNITEIVDAAQQTLFFAGAVVEPRGRYVYDAVYWLVEASGREHPGQQPADEDYPRAPLPHPNDGQALRSYTERYVYDAAGNIARMEHAAPDGNWTRRYQYAADSNRLMSTSLPGDPEGGPYSALYEHDDHGNMTRMPHLAEMRWDHGDRLVDVDLGGGGEAFYAYDGGGERVRKVVEKSGLREERIYLGGYEVFRRHAGGGIDLKRETLHVMDDQRRVALVETKTREEGVPIDAPTPRLRYQLDNHLGSSLLELDGDGGVITYEEYFPYGGTAYHAARSGVEVSAKRYRYTGKERDEETGLYYYGARYYAAWLGRWVSADPAGLVDGPNLYAYVGDNPIARKDPSGFQQVVNDLDPRNPSNYEGFDSFAHGYQVAIQASISPAELRSIWDTAHPTAGRDSPQTPGPSGFNLERGTADDPVVMGCIGNDCYLNIRQSEYNRRVWAAGIQRDLGTLDNIRGGIFGTLGYGIASLFTDDRNTLNAASGLGAIVDQTAVAVVATRPQRSSQPQLVPPQLQGAAAPPSTVRVFRVEGAPNTRIIIGTSGQVAIQGEQTLFLNFGDRARAEQFLTQRLGQGMPAATVRSFEVSRSFLDDLRSAAVPERLARQFPDRPIVVDVTKAPGQFGLRPEQVDELRRAIIQGTGREGR